VRGQTGKANFWRRIGDLPGVYFAEFLGFATLRPTGYRQRKRRWAMGGELAEPDTRVEPFVVRENSLLASTPEAPIHTLLAGPNRVYEGDDGELYFEDPEGRWFHYLDDWLLEELRKTGT